MSALSWVHNDVTGWAACASLGGLFLLSLLRGWIILRPNHRDLVDGAVKAALAEASAEVVKTGFYREAYAIERERNGVLAGGLVTIVTEIRNAVIAPGRPQ